MNNIKNYVLFLMFSIILTIVLIFMNFIVLNKISLKQPATKCIKITEQLPQLYGYSDILSLVSENSNLELLNISTTKTQNGIINADIKFNCVKENLTSILTYITTKDNFKTMNFITINTENKFSDKKKLLLDGIINADFIKDNKN